MKKYLSLFVVLMLAFVINVPNTRAEDGATLNNTSVNARVRIKAQADLKMKRDRAEAEIKAKREILKSQIKDKRTEIKTNIKEKRAELKTQIQNKREEIQTEIKANREMAIQKMEDLRAKIKEEKDAVKAKIKETRIIGREKALERFDAAVLRINNLKDRVNAQITKLEAKGVDVINAENFVATAEVELSDAKIKIAEANALLSVSINELTPENKTELRTLKKDAQALIVKAHEALKDAVKSLKEEVKIKMEAEAL